MSFNNNCDQGRCCDCAPHDSDTTLYIVLLVIVYGIIAGVIYGAVRYMSEVL
jgi:hypothetical protein